MIARFVEGQKVRIGTLVDSQGRLDQQVQRHVREVGTVVKVYCVTRDELPDLSKMFVYPDVYCCDVRLDEDDVVLTGIPEIALEPHVF
jgi:hypothetical protein